MTAVKVWVDDIRTPPDASWLWFKDSASALAWMGERHAAGLGIGDTMSLDHDLGGDDTTRPIVLWMCENEAWATDIRVHSANPVGREWLEGMVSRYAPEGTAVRSLTFAERMRRGGAG